MQSSQLGFHRAPFSVGDKLTGRPAISYLSLPIPGELTALIRLRRCASAKS
jgi:hypothetical protein